jgi:hypothetical protein
VPGRTHWIKKSNTETQDAANVGRKQTRSGGDVLLSPMASFDAPKPEVEGSDPWQSDRSSETEPNSAPDAEPFPRSCAGQQ